MLEAEGSGGGTGLGFLGGDSFLGFGDGAFELHVAEIGLQTDRGGGGLADLLAENGVDDLNFHKVHVHESNALFC